MCPLGLWLHRVSLLSWGSAGWTPPSRMPSSSWDYIQLAAPTLWAGTYTRQGPWLGTSRGPSGLTFPSCPPGSSSIWQLLHSIWRLLLWLHPTPALLARSDPVCLPCAPFSGFRTLCFSAVHSLLNMMVSSLSPHLWFCLRAAQPTSHLCAFSLSPPVQEKAFPLRVTQVSSGSPVARAQAPKTRQKRPPPSILRYLLLWAWPLKL